MTSIKLIINGAHAQAEVSGPLTGGMVGIPVTIGFDGAWEGLSRTLVCKGGGTVKSIVGIGTAAAVAHEVMQAGSTLYLGVEGRDAEGTIVMPTVWACCGIIEAGANASEDESTAPDSPVWALLQQQIGTLDDLETLTRENLVQAINEVLSNDTVSAHNGDTSAHSDIRTQIASLPIPIKVSELTNDAGYLTAHQDISDLAKNSDLTAHSENGDIHVTSAQKAAWNAKSDFSGSYNDLSDKPAIPAVPDKLSELTNDLYGTVPLEVTYGDGTTETVNMVVAV